MRTALLFVMLMLIHCSLSELSPRTDEYGNDEQETDDKDFFGDDDDKPDEWVDFNDMMNFDASVGKMKKKTLKDKLKDTGEKMKNKVKEVADKVKDKISGVVCPECTCDEYKANFSAVTSLLDACKREKKKLLSKLTLFEGDTQDEKGKTSQEAPYMKRYVKFILGLIPNQIPIDDYYEYKVNLEVTHGHKEALERFADDGQGIQDALSALEGMTKDVQLVTEPYQDPKVLWFKENFTFWNVMHFITILILAKIAMGFSMRVHLGYSWFQLTMRILIFMYIVSIPWNWWHLYQVEVARRHADMLKDVPVECQSESQGIISSFFSAFSFSRDKCAEYHEKLLVDPMWEVAPTRAIAVTTSKFVLEPLEHLGHGISKFIQATVADLPLHMQPFVFGLCVLLIVIMVIMFFGYNIRIFHFFGLENAGGAGVVGQAQQRLRLQEAQDECHQLKEEILHLKSDKRDLERERERDRSDMDMLMARMQNLQISDRPHTGTRGAEAPAIAPIGPPPSDTSSQPQAPQPESPLNSSEQDSDSDIVTQLRQAYVPSPPKELSGSASKDSNSSSDKTHSSSNPEDSTDASNTMIAEASDQPVDADKVIPAAPKDDQLPLDIDDNEDIYTANLAPDDPRSLAAKQKSQIKEDVPHIEPRRAPAILDLTEATDNNFARSQSLNETELIDTPQMEALNLVQSAETSLINVAMAGDDRTRAQSESLASYEVMSDIASGLPGNFQRPVEDVGASTMTSSGFEEINPEDAPRELEHPGVSLPKSVLLTKQVSRPMQESSALTESQPSLKMGQPVSSYMTDNDECNAEDGDRANLGEVDGQNQSVEELGAIAPAHYAQGESRPGDLPASMATFNFMANVGGDQQEDMTESWQHVEGGQGDARGDYTPSTDSDIEVIDESLRSVEERN